MEAGDKWWLVTHGTRYGCVHTCEHGRGVENSGEGWSTVCLLKVRKRDGHEEKPRWCVKLVVHHTNLCRHREQWVLEHTLSVYHLRKEPSKGGLRIRHLALELSTRDHMHGCHRIHKQGSRGTLAREVADRAATDSRRRPERTASAEREPRSLERITKRESVRAESSPTRGGGANVRVEAPARRSSWAHSQWPSSTATRKAESPCASVKSKRTVGSSSSAPTIVALPTRAAWWSGVDRSTPSAFTLAPCWMSTRTRCEDSREGAPCTAKRSAPSRSPPPASPLCERQNRIFCL